MSGSQPGPSSPPPLCRLLWQPGRKEYGKAETKPCIIEGLPLPPAKQSANTAESRRNSTPASRRPVRTGGIRT